MQETWKIGGRIVASLSMSIMHLPYGAVNDRTQLRLQVFIRVFSLRIATEVIEDLRYKLRCFGIPVEGPAKVFYDNMLVVNNSSIPTSVLNKMQDAICDHRVREAQAADIIWVECIPG